MFTPSVTSGARAHHHEQDSDNAVAAQSNEASAKPKEKAAESSLKKPQFAEDNRYNASPMASSSGQARVARLTRSHAALHNDSLQGTPPTTPERGSSSMQGTAVRTPPRTPDRRGMAFQQTPPGPSERGAGPSLQRMDANRENPEWVKALEDMDIKNSHKANRAAPAPDPNRIKKKVPERLQEKIDAIDLPKLKKLDANLYDHAQHSIGRIKKGRPPNENTVNLDTKLLPTFVKMENSRNPGLNLHHFQTAAECYDGIRKADKEVLSSKEPKSMRVIYRPIDRMVNHHAMLDVRLRPDYRPSIIAIESAGILGSTLEMALNLEFPEARSTVIASDVQNSEWDCIMFAMSNALKAYKHGHDYMATKHDDHLMTLEDRVARRRGGYKEAPFPADFLKHAHSKTRVSEAPNKGDLVTKDKVGLHSETLEHRNLAYRAPRYDKTTHKHVAYSTSIEGFRLQEIRRAGEYLEAQLEAQGVNISQEKDEKKKGGVFSFLRNT